MNTIKSWPLVRKNGLLIALYIIFAVFIWVVLMIALPQLYMLDFSFRKFDVNIGRASDVKTIENYQYLITGTYENVLEFNSLHLSIFFKTILSAVLVTVLNVILCYPIAYLLAQVFKGVTLRILLLAVICPFWVNEILRSFAFRIIFGDGGVINRMLMAMGLLDSPFDFINADIALYVGLSYAYILLMIMPLYNVIENLDHNQIEASTDLGAPWWKTHWRIIIPHAKPGIASGSIMVFMLSAGTLATPQILGGTSSLWFTQVIERWMNASSNWPQAAAYAFALLLACIAIVLLILKFFKVNLGVIGK